MTAESASRTIAALDFHDGHVQDLRIVGDEAWMLFKDWRDRLFTIHFSGVAFVQSGPVGDTLGARVRKFSSEKESVLERMEWPGVTDEIDKQRERLVHLEIFNEDYAPTDIIFVDCQVTPALPSVTS